MRNIDELPMADAELERDVRRLFQFDMSPEEYAARNAHGWYCFSLDNHRYSDPQIERWIHRLGDIFFNRNGAPTVDALRRQYLTDEERTLFEEREKEEF